MTCKVNVIINTHTYIRTHTNNACSAQDRTRAVSDPSSKSSYFENPQLLHLRMTLRKAPKARAERAAQRGRLRARKGGRGQRQGGAFPGKAEVPLPDLPAIL